MPRPVSYSSFGGRAARPRGLPWSYRAIPKAQRVNPPARATKPRRAVKIANRVHSFNLSSDEYIAYQGPEPNTMVMKNMQTGAVEDPDFMSYAYNQSTLLNDVQTNYMQCAFTFRLKDIINVSELTALFDQYRVRGVVVQIDRLSGDVSVMQTGGSSTRHYLIPEFLSAIDYDDNKLIEPTDLLQYGVAKLRKDVGNRPQKYYIRPKLTKPVYNGEGVAPGYTVENACWLDCSQSNIEHYGLKMCINNLNGSSDVSWVYRFRVKYVIDFKNTR